MNTSLEPNSNKNDATFSSKDEQQQILYLWDLNDKELFQVVCNKHFSPSRTRHHHHRPEAPDIGAHVGPAPARPRIRGRRSLIIRETRMSA